MINQDEVVKSCTSCQAVKHSPAVVPIQPWTWPYQPLLCFNFAGSLQGSRFLVAVNAHSKWPEVFVMKETTATKAIEILRVIFVRFGLPKQVVTDNGHQYV